MLNVDIKALVEKIKELSCEIKKHKKNYRRSWPPYPRWDYETKTKKWERVDELMKFGDEIFHPSYSIFRRQVLAHSVTVLCAVRAHLRGRIHMKGFTFEEQEKFIEKNQRDYSLCKIEEISQEVTAN